MGGGSILLLRNPSMDPGRHKDPEKDVWAPGWLLAQEKRVEGTYKSYQSK